MTWIYRRNLINRAIKADYLYFNEDGTIQKVIPTVRGIGNAPATNKIQIDRYSAMSEAGTVVEYLILRKHLMDGRRFCLRRTPGFDTTEWILQARR